ncbi:MAG: rod shape-determining protein MreC [Acidobacteria bacterium]|nr:rod shape-determining protein MreC [Acidobacteriota bacterium]
MALGFWRRSSGGVTFVALEFACFLLVTYQIQVAPHLSLLEKMALTLFSPIQHLAYETSDYFVMRMENRKSMEALQADNQRMADQLQYMKQFETRIAELESENARLTELMQVAASNPWTSVLASVIGRASKGDDAILIIDKGSRHGITRDMGVIAASGVVGIVWEVSPFYAKIMTANNPGTAIAAMIQRSRYADAYLVGHGENKGRLENVPGFTSVNVADRVVTSGLDGLFPKGQLLGTVLHVNTNSQMFLEIDVQLTTEFAALEEVLILLPTIPGDAP